MRHLSEITARIRSFGWDAAVRLRSLFSLVTGRPEDQELTEEIRFHIEKQTEKNVAAGMRPEEARRQAHIKFGGVERMKEKTREARGVRGLERLWRDALLAVRRIRRRPGFAVVVILTLALGIGANAAIYQIFTAVELRSLPVSEPESLAIVELADQSRFEGRRTSGYPVLPNPVWERMRDGGNPFETMLAWAGTEFWLGSSGASVSGGGVEASGDGGVAGISGLARGLFVSGDFFRVLGVPPSIGRTFTAEDDFRGCGNGGAVLSHGFWQRRFGGDPTAVGRTIALNGEPVSIIGVAAEGFTGPEVGRTFDVAVPICSHSNLGGEDGWLDASSLWWLTVMGRVPADRTLDVVNAELAGGSPALFEATVPPGYSAERAERHRNHSLRAVPGAEGVSSVRDRYANPLRILLAVTAMVLLIVCTNLANLFLAQGSTRQQEFAVRQALGASRTRLLTQMGVEAGLLAAAGAVAGLTLAVGLRRYLLTLFGSDLVLDLGVDPSLIVFAVAVAGVSCAIFGLIPAWQASGRSSGGTGAQATQIAGTGRGAASASRGFGLRRALVISQVALSFVLLFGALLFTSTLRNLLSVETGFDVQGTSVAHLDFAGLEMSEEATSAFKADVLDRIRSLPGVAAAAEVRHVPMGGTGSGITARAVGTDPAAGVPVRLNLVTDGFLETLGIPLISGRPFPEGASSEQPLALVNPTFARRLGLEANPVGVRFRAEEVDLTFEIIGVVPDTKYFNLREEALPIVFVPKSLFPDPRAYTDILLRSNIPPGDLGASVQEAVSLVSPQVRVETRPFREMIDDGVLRERLMAVLSGFFGILAALVAAIGLYGVLSYLVVRQTTDIGVRLALGAGRGDVLAMVFRRGGTLLLSGLALGSALAILSGFGARALLFGLEPYDLGVLAQTIALFTAVAAAACYLPARRASRLEPTAALREE